MLEEMFDERRSTIIIFDEMTGTNLSIGSEKSKVYIEAVEQMVNDGITEKNLEERISLARKMILPASAASIPIAYADLLAGRRRRPRFNFIPELLELKPNPLWAETEYPVRPIDIQRGGWGR